MNLDGPVRIQFLERATAVVIWNIKKNKLQGKAIRNVHWIIFAEKQNIGKQKDFKIKL